MLANVAAIGNEGEDVEEFRPEGQSSAPAPDAEPAAPAACGSSATAAPAAPAPLYPLFNLQAWGKSVPVV